MGDSLSETFPEPEWFKFVNLSVLFCNNSFPRLTLPKKEQTNLEMLQRSKFTKETELGLKVDYSCLLILREGLSQETDPIWKFRKCLDFWELHTI